MKHRMPQKEASLLVLKDCTLMVMDGWMWRRYYQGKLTKEFVWDINNAGPNQTALRALHEAREQIVSRADGGLDRMMLCLIVAAVCSSGQIIEETLGQRVSDRRVNFVGLTCRMQEYSLS